jgi:hypothetical protein
LHCLNDPFFASKFLPDVTPGEIDYLNIKYFNGLGDVFIPYDNTFNEEKRNALYNKLNSIENIEKYNLYFVGIKTSIKYNSLMFRHFKPEGFTSKLKSNFIQSRTLLQAYEEFLNYSYLNNKILLDVNEFLNSEKRSF